MTQHHSELVGKKAEPVAIIGLACLFPGSPDLSAYWAALKSGRDALVDIPKDHWSIPDYYDPDPKAEDKTYGRRGGFLDPVPFEPLKYGIVPNDLPAIDSTQLLGLVAADRALKDAGYGTDNGYDHRRTAVMLGVTGALKMVVSLGSRLAHPQLKKALADSGVDAEASAEVLRRFANEFTPWQENSFPGLLGNVTAGRIANRLNLGGANLVVDAACASSLAAIRQGLMELRSGGADLVVTGGVDTFSDPFMYTCFSKTPALSPSGEVRAYDQDGDGTMLGEGLGVLVLKRLSEARRDGDKIYAVIRSVGSSSDGKGAAIFAPTADGQVRALNDAYAQAEISPQSVGLVEGHGTGTAVGDAVEVEALNQVFSQGGRAEKDRPWSALGSVKSQIGHTKAAAGAAGLIKAALALYSKTLPPTAKVKTPLPILTAPGSPFHLSSRPRPWLSTAPRRAGVSAFGFGGSNFHCVLEEADHRKEVAEAPSGFDLFTFSASTAAELAGSLKAALAQSPVEAARNSRKNYRFAECRLILALAPAEFPSVASSLAAWLTAGAGLESLPPGVFYGQSPDRKTELGFWWPEPQLLRQNFCRELAAEWPEMLGPLSEAAARFNQANPGLAPLDLLLYPPDLVSPEKLAAWSRDFANPRCKESANEAIRRGLTDILAKFGLKTDRQVVGSGHNGELNSKAGLWLDLSSSQSLSKTAGELGLETLAFDQTGDSALDLAGLLARLAAAGYEPDFRAWPEPAFYEAHLPEADDSRVFKVMVTGANYFVKKDLPPSTPRKVSAGAGDNKPLLSVLENLTAETARLHQEFLNTQAEAIRLMSQGLDGAPGASAAPPTPAPPAAAPRPTMAAAPIEIQAAPMIPAPAPAAAVADGVTGGLEEVVLKAVAEETGYPLEMLNLDLDLESDLGLDSIKKVEIMAVLSEKLPEVQGLGAETMNSAVTLRDLVALVGPVSGERPAAPSGFLGNPVSPSATEDLWPLLREVVSAETGYPKEMLVPAMKLGDDLGLDSIKLVEIASAMSEQMAEAAPLSADALSSAETLADLAAALDQAAPPPAGLAAPSLETRSFPSAPAPSAGQVPAASSTSSATVLEVVAQETGYPQDMLRPDMDLEGDLGLDSIKKVEIMAALSERLPQIEALSTAEVMAEIATLGDLIALTAQEAGPESAPAPAPAAAFEAFEAPKASPAPAAAPDQGDLLLEVVAAETGYPKDMLSYEATLEGDLGLDSIKRVEIMAALSERLGDDSLAASSADVLSGAVTLGDLRDILAGALPAPRLTPLFEEKEAAPPEALREAPRRGPGRPPKNSPLAFKLETPPEAQELTRTQAVTSFQVLPLPLSGLGGNSLNLPAGAQVGLVARTGPAAEEMENWLKAQNLAVNRFQWSEAESLGDLTGLKALIMIWPGQDNDLSLASLAFRAIRAAGPALKGAAEQKVDPLLLGLTFMGGTFGLNREDRLESPVSAALTGLLKSAAREWPQVRVRALDMPKQACGAQIKAFWPGVGQAVSSGAPVEIGLTSPDCLVSPKLAPYKLKNIRVRHLKEGQTVIVTGGARGVTAAASKEVARASRPHLVILGRTPLPPPEPNWLKDLKDEAAIRKVLFDRAKVKPGPRELAAESSLLLAGREIKNNLAAMEKAGARVTYVSGAFAETQALKAAVEEIKKAHGPIHGFIHGAGVLRDSLISDKNNEDWDLVFNTKARMAAVILEELASQPLNLVAFFSSSTARFGRRGQADYAAGNEILNKLAQTLAVSRQAPKCLSINWGPWEGGMVDSGLKRLFENEGIGLIPLDEGARLFSALVGSPKNDPVEVVVLGPSTDLSALEEY